VLPGDVDRHVRDGLLEGVQQDPGLQAAAAAELHQPAARTDARRHLVHVGPHDLKLGAGGVVLGQRGDALEQCRAVLIVEELAGNALRLAAKPGKYLLPEIVDGLEVMEGDRAG
jgi:hypothetical protein